ncbi:class Ib ribonucleoside-diphosphate reductase assembly flavoprotein NrdI [Corynebacterium sp. H128]|uniref:class Ib ribonucleoside-diphosphate reductase assembly flavoprotein NrdI n=1 Tax=unclassified Corynebacterium TaxID=2624378 RepID=UPI0030A050F4
MSSPSLVGFRDLTPDQSPELVYFSSVSGNTHRFILRLGRPAVRIPLRLKKEPMIRVCRPFVLVVPTYGGGKRASAVPKQVIAFLNDPVNRSYLRGVITAGNTNFGVDYCIAGPIIAAKCQVPELYRFELLGTQRDLARVNRGLEAFWENSPNTPQRERTRS